MQVTVELPAPRGMGQRLPAPRGRATNEASRLTSHSGDTHRLGTSTSLQVFQIPDSSYLVTLILRRLQPRRCSRRLAAAVLRTCRTRGRHGLPGFLSPITVVDSRRCMRACNGIHEVTVIKINSRQTRDFTDDIMHCRRLALAATRHCRTVATEAKLAELGFTLPVVPAPKVRRSPPRQERALDSHPHSRTRLPLRIAVAVA